MKEEIEKIMYRDAVGKENAISSTEMATRVGIDEGNGNPVSRSMIRDLLRSGVPILACNSGYYIPETQKEVEEYIEKLNSRIEGIEDRKRMVRSATNDL